MAEPRPQLSLNSGSGHPEAIVLVLHGGREIGMTAVRANQLAVLRMIPFARRISGLAAGRVAVGRLRYAVRGWNATGDTSATVSLPAPVRDVYQALAQLRERFGEIPVGLVGHSMGGRTALRCGGADGVGSVVALAPWLPAGEPVEQLVGRHILLVHGTADRMTSPRGSELFYERLRSRGVPASLVMIDGEKHGMLARGRLWHELAAQFVLSTLLADFETSELPDAPNLLAAAIAGGSRINC